MAKVGRVRRLKYSCGKEKAESESHKILKDIKKRPHKLSEKKDWEDATCSVCLEYPHNAVLLLCSSYNKGCRPYMCATSYRLSNCLDQYKQAYTKAALGAKAPGVGFGCSTEKVSELLCPLCRGQVKGWTLVEPARKHLNKKKRTCMQEKCSFVGNYKQLKKHVKVEHPWARPREVDPSQEEKWKRLENERELNDVISTFAPGALVLGDYVLDDDFGDYDSEIEDSSEDDFGAFGANTIGRGRFHLLRTSGTGYDSYDEDDDDDIALDGRLSFSRNVGRDVGPISRHHRRMLFIGRPPSRRRWRQ